MILNKKTALLFLFQILFFQHNAIARIMGKIDDYLENKIFGPLEKQIINYQKLSEAEKNAIKLFSFLTSISICSSKMLEIFYRHPKNIRNVGIMSVSYASAGYISYEIAKKILDVLKPKEANFQQADSRSLVLNEHNLSLMSNIHPELKIPQISLVIALKTQSLLLFASAAHIMFDNHLLIEKISTNRILQYMPNKAKYLFSGSLFGFSACLAGFGLIIGNNDVKSCRIEKNQVPENPVIER